MEAAVSICLKAGVILMEELLFQEAMEGIRIHLKVLFSKNIKIILKIALNSTLDLLILLKMFSSIIIQLKDRPKLTRLKINQDRLINYSNQKS
jgi:hypothetical protein